MPCLKVGKHWGTCGEDTKQRHVAAKFPCITFAFSRMICYPQRVAWNSGRFEFDGHWRRDEMTSVFNVAFDVHCSCKLSPLLHILMPQSASWAPACVLLLQHASFVCTQKGLLPLHRHRCKIYIPLWRCADLKVQNVIRYYRKEDRIALFFLYFALFFSWVWKSNRFRIITQRNWLKISHHSLIPSEVKSKPIASYPLTFLVA